MGNICRSPTAEGVFRHIGETAGLGSVLLVDSAGTHGAHAGELPDPRSRAVAARRGYDLGNLRARKVQADDFARFDLILAMDGYNLQNLQTSCPPEFKHKLRLLLEFSRRFPVADVPDPYYGGAAGFERVLDMVEDASHGLLHHARQQLGIAD